MAQIEDTTLRSVSIDIGAIEGNQYRLDGLIDDLTQFRETVGGNSRVRLTHINTPGGLRVIYSERDGSQV